jgi:hypothetical protein
MAAATNNGNSAVATPERAIVPAGLTSQASYSGTPRGPDGTTTPDDYVRELANPVKRMEIFEEMGNDDAVHTAIDARRQEINAANWQLSTEDTSTLGREILEFVEDNLYPMLDDMLRWLGGGALHYGFGALEPVYQWSDRPIVAALSRGKVKRATKSGERRIYLAKLAHIRQTAVATFKISETGDLNTIQQHTFTGSRFRQVEIPAEKTLLWTYNRQGDDYWGVPPTRHCYKAWKFKTQLERLNLLHFDKFGVGIPVGEAGEGWTQAEYNTLATALQNYRSGANSYIVHPTGGKVSVLTATGEISGSGLEWWRAYNLAVAKVFLTQMTELGSTETGARALGETFYDQMGGIVQADCEELAALINNRVIVPLVQYNYGEQEFYPTFAPSQRVKAGQGVATVLQSLITAKVIHPRPEDEAWFRDAFELPPVALDVLKKEQGVRDAMAQSIANQSPDAGGNPGSGGDQPNRDGNAPRPGDGPPGPRRVAASRRQLSYTLADGAPTAAVWGKTTYRSPEFTAWEHGILKPDALMQELDLHVSRLAGEATDVLRQIDESLTAQCAALAAKGAQALSDGVRTIAVPERLRTQLRKVLMAAAERARTFGATAVRNEIERQLGPSGIGPQRAPGYYRALAQDDSDINDLHVSAQVDRAVEDEIDRREQSARSSVLTVLAQAARETGTTMVEITETALKSAFQDLSTGRTQQNVQEVVNVGFGVGRTEEAAATQAGETSVGGGRSGLRDANGNPIELVAKVYSAVMDMGTCDECAKWDGAEFPIDYPEDHTGVQAPNPRCSGSFSRCRCVWIYVTDKESVPLVPASKGPEPIRRNVA